MAAVVLVLAIKAWVVNPYRIPTPSMEPKLHCARPEAGCQARFSDRVLANRFIYHFKEPERGDIVVFETTDLIRQRCMEGGTFVKRIIGLPGETVTVNGDGFVSIEGRPLDEPYVDPGRRGGTFGTWRVAEDSYFLLGDNRRQSCDSRSWQSLPEERIIGEVFAIYWPPGRIGLAALLVGTSLLPLGLRAGRRPIVSMSNTIQSLEQRQLRTDLPRFKAGDTVRVHFRVIEGQRQRVQVFEGIVIKRQGAGVRETFTVRKQSFGVGVERTFPVHSPKIEKLEVQAIGDVNRAKLYYLREKVGRKARVREQQRGERLSSAGAPPPGEDEPDEAAEEVAEAAEDGEEAPSV